MHSFLKTLTFCFFVLMILQSRAQEKFAKYDNSYIKKEYDIQISVDRKDSYSLYIDAMSFDRIYEKGGIILKQNRHQDFLDAVAEAKTKYEEWIKTAKENNVKDFSKSMTIKSKAAGYFLYGNKWNFQFWVNLQFDFRILESKGVIVYLLLINTGELQSSSNQFMKVDGFALVFSSVKEIDDFTAAISADKIAEYMKKPKVDDMFKE